MANQLVKFGEPCWNRDELAKAISVVAQLDEKRAHYFLACHAPIKHIRDDRTGDELTEDTFFDKLMSARRRETLAFVYGEPGSGKSHLIFWLMLRCKDAIQTGHLKGVTPVLIERRTGSLKDALEQMVRQLPKEFEGYLAPVQAAVAQISATTARELLAGALHLELLAERRRERGLDRLPRALEELGNTCTSTGFRKWLIRDHGTIAASISRLIEVSGVEDRLDAPMFSPAEFKVDHNPAYYEDNTPLVRALIDDLEDEEELRVEAARVFNEALPFAVREMTGLSGTRLREVFDQIRTDLQARGQMLALFVEDVSAMAVLDQEIVNAVEPQSRDELCRIVSVLGMTEAGLKRLPPNLKDRATHIVSVGGTVVDQWRGQTEEVARFAARYLNAVRLDEDQLTEVAKQRRAGRDVTVSSCDGCNVRDDCHRTFGYVALDGVEIGMFPLTAGAPQRLLRHLRESADGVRRNPRGLLEFVLYPLLDQTEALEDRRFPAASLPVALPELPYWTGFEGKYCGNWRAQDVKRLKLLAQAWISAESGDEAAALLKPFLQPLGFNAFSARTEPVTQTPGPPDEASDSGRSQRAGTQERKLQEILGNLSSWMDDEQLQGDQEIRQLVAELVRDSLAWDDERRPPISVWEDLVGSGYDFVRIEGMWSRPRGTHFSITLPRSRESRDLIEALAQFRFRGARTWQFPDGERHKRTVSQWIRAHEDIAMRALEPPSPLSAAAPLKTAAQFLALTACVRDRGPLPSEPEAVLNALLADIPEALPTALSAEWRRLLVDMTARHRLVREFVRRELNVPQGRGKKVAFIDPMPVIRAAEEFRVRPSLDPLADEYFSSFWKARYEPLDGIGKGATLELVLAGEFEQLDVKRTEIRALLRVAGYKTDSLTEALEAYCADLLYLVEVARLASIAPWTPVFDSLLREKIFAQRVGEWREALVRAERVLAGSDPLDIVFLDPEPLVELHDALVQADKYRTALEKDLRDQIEHNRGVGEADDCARSLLESLRAISALGGESEPLTD